jgi:MYXO-CTERM domain-containing protein
MTETAQISFRAYGEPGEPTLEPRRPYEPERLGGAVLRDSAYGDVYRLAQRLRAGTATPYAYVERVLDHLSEDYAYSEQTPRRSVPLAAFLLRDREGYCQQFSGAMALLLRMGGVPARVSTGFSPGTLDRDRGEYVVRDTDAHSWVEAYIAPFGWVTFDPTPPVGPARVSAVVGDAASPYQLAAPESAIGAGDRVTDTGFGTGPADEGSATAIAGGAGALTLVAAGGLLVWRRRRRRSGPPPVENALAELQAALASTGRPASPDLTLHAMLGRYGGTPAEPYLRTLEAARYGGADVAPTPEMRAALRRELTLGLGPGAWLGAWRAIPPVLARGSRARSSYPEPR